MLFNSLQFALFLPAVVVVYYAIPLRARWAFLLGASYYFYASWRVEYLVLIIGSTLVDYVCGLRMARLSTRAERRRYLVLSVVTNLGLLFTFKYADFAGSSLNAIFAHFNILAEVPAFNLLLPVGISFYTFQSMSYTIDMYRGRVQVERHVGYFALYVAFFPQLVAGPIERSSHLLPQLRHSRPLDYDAVSRGLKLILWGFFLKLVVADRLAIYVDAVYGNQAIHSGTTIAVATVFFAFQVYGDFAGYSSIAIGSARLMGIELTQNFSRPYFATSIEDLWRRWHISLTSWFRDYVYIPLGGNRRSPMRVYVNLMMVFAISGIWHGASWTFICFGLIHGVYLGLYRHWSLRRTRGLPDVPVSRVVATACTFAMWCLALVFFRATSLGDAVAMLEKFARPGTELWIGSPSTFGYSAMAILVLVAVEARQEITNGVGFFENRNAHVRMASYVATAAWILLFGVFDGGQFIYFQF